MRWSNKEYDAIIEQLRRELDPAKRAGLYIKANDIHVGDYAQIPLVYRREVYAKVRGLQVGTDTPWDSQLWNVANWVKR
jgi:peptide/nickel transport system substrate-binding protein